MKEGVEELDFTGQAHVQAVGTAVDWRHLARARRHRRDAHETVVGALTSVWLRNQRRTCRSVPASHPGRNAPYDLGWPRARAAVALAGKLGTDPVIFPGGHGGYGSHPDIFAETVSRAFQ
jgi:hypothetical protein